MTSGMFEAAVAIGRTLPGVEAGVKYDGSPVLKLGGAFMAGLAMHESAEAGTMVVRCGMEDRVGLLEDAPGTYYLTDYYRRHPVVLVRLACVGPDELRELLRMSWRLTEAKAARSGILAKPAKLAKVGIDARQAAKTPR